jgi:RNA polymerase sigma factor (sigma-70 family)
MAKSIKIEELSELIKLHRAGDRKATDTIVKHYIGMVYRNAVKYTGFADFDDLVGEGSFGLMKAINKYNPKYKVQFTTYAAPWIDAYQRRWSKQSKTMVRHDDNNVQGVLADYSLNVAIDSEDPQGETFMDLLISQTPSPDHHVEVKDIQRDVTEDLKKLSPRQRHILKMRIMADVPMTLEDVAKNSPNHKSVSRERVRQEQLEAERRFKSIYSTRTKCYDEELEPA